MLVVAGIVITVYRYTREITSARDQVNALNASLESRVAARTAELARANEEIQRFAHIVSHDLRAPLVNIVGFASEMEQCAGDAAGPSSAAPPTGRPRRMPSHRPSREDDMPEALGFIRSSTRKMDTLINSILKISREGQRRLQPEHDQPRADHRGDARSDPASAYRGQRRTAASTCRSRRSSPTGCRWSRFSATCWTMP